MPTYTITDPQGRDWDIDAPEGSSQEDALNYFKGQWKPMAADELAAWKKSQGATQRAPDESVAQPKQGQPQFQLSPMPAPSKGKGDVARWQTDMRRRIETDATPKSDYVEGRDAPWTNPNITGVERKLQRYLAEPSVQAPEDDEVVFSPIERAQIKNLKLREKVSTGVKTGVDVGGKALGILGGLSSLVTGGLGGLLTFGAKLGGGYAAGKAAERAQEITGFKTGLEKLSTMAQEGSKPVVETLVNAGVPPRLATLLFQELPVDIVRALPELAIYASMSKGYKATGAALEKGADIAGLGGPKGTGEFTEPAKAARPAPEVVSEETTLTPDQRLVEGYRRAPLKVKHASANPEYNAAIEGQLDSNAKLPTYTDFQKQARSVLTETPAEPDWTRQLEARTKAAEDAAAAEQAAKTGAPTVEQVGPKRAQVAMIERADPAEVTKAKASKGGKRGRRAAEKEALKKAADPQASPADVRAASPALPLSRVALEASGDLPESVAAEKLVEADKLYTTAAQETPAPKGPQTEAEKAAAALHELPGTRSLFSWVSLFEPVKKFLPDIAQRMFQMDDLAYRPLENVYRKAYASALEIPRKMIKGFYWNKEYAPTQGQELPADVQDWVRHAKRLGKEAPIGRVTYANVMAGVLDGRVSMDALPPELRDLVPVLRNITDTYSAQMEQVPPELLRGGGYYTHRINHPATIAEMRNLQAQRQALQDMFFEDGGTKGLVPRDNNITSRNDVPGFDIDNLMLAFEGRLAQGRRKIVGEPMAKYILSRMSRASAEEVMDKMGMPKDPVRRNVFFENYKNRLQRLHDVALGKPDSSYAALDAWLETATPEFITNLFSRMDRSRVVDFLRSRLGMSDSYIQNILPRQGWTREALTAAGQSTALALTAFKPSIPLWELASRGVANNVGAEGYMNTGKGVGMYVRDSLRKYFNNDYMTTSELYRLPNSPLMNLVDNNGIMANSPGMINAWKRAMWTPGEVSRIVGYGITKHAAYLSADKAYWELAGKPGYFEHTGQNYASFVQKYVADSMNMNEFQYGRFFQAGIYDTPLTKLLMTFQNFKGQRMAFLSNLWNAPAQQKIMGVPAGVIRYAFFMGLPAFVAQKMGMDIDHWQGTAPKKAREDAARFVPEALRANGVLSNVGQAATDVASSFAYPFIEGWTGPVSGPFADLAEKLRSGYPGEGTRALAARAADIGYGSLNIPIGGIKSLRDLLYQAGTGQRIIPSRDLQHTLFPLSAPETAGYISPGQALAQYMGMHPELEQESVKKYRKEKASAKRGGKSRRAKNSGSLADILYNQNP